MIFIIIILLASLMYAVWNFFFAAFDNNKTTPKKKKERCIKAVVAAIVFMLTPVYLLARQNQAYGPFESTRHTITYTKAKASCAENLYQDHNGKYFIIEANLWDITLPEKRVYLDTSLVDDYIQAQSKLVEKFKGE